MPEENNHMTYSGADIEKYWTGQLSSQEMHAMEKAALDDPFLADAMEGYRNLKDNKQPVGKDIAELKERLKDMLENREVPVISRTRWWRLAAVFVILVGIGVVVYRLLVSDYPQQQVAVRKETASTENESRIAINDSAAENNIAPKKDSSKLLAKNDSKGQRLSSHEMKSPVDKTHQLGGKTAISSAADEAAKYNAPAAEDNVMESTKDPGFKKEPESIYVFSGRVMDNNYKPVRGASINIQGQRNVAADANGFFNFDTKDSVANVTVESAGFEPADIALRNSAKPNEIFLKESGNGLNGKASGVVVSGYEARAKKSLPKNRELEMNMQSAMPVNGWDQFNAYIEKNKRVPESENEKGEVAVSFYVDKDGGLTKLNIERPLSPALDKEAIRLISEGPKWKLLNKKRSKMTVSIKF
jgi:hypothetical protein